MNEPSSQYQQMLLNFLGMIQPSMYRKIMRLEYTSVFNSVISIRGNEEAVDYLMERFTLQLIEPEHQIMRFGHHINCVSIIGTGFAKVFKYFDSRNRI